MPTGRLAETSGAARLQVLDKVTARTHVLEAPLGRPLAHDNLTITVETCWRSLPLEVPEAAAWLRIDEHPRTFQGGVSRDPDAARPVFRGWVYASSPSVSPVEHAVYDVVLLSCSEE